MAAEPPPARHRSRLPASPGSIGLIAVAVIVTLFAVLNLNTVEVSFIVFSGRAPLIVVIAVAMLLGVAFGALAQRQSARRGPRG